MNRTRLLVLGGVLLLVLGLAVGVQAARWLARHERPEAVVQLVRHVETVYRDRPVIHTSFVDKIIWKTVPPETVLVSLPGTADTIVTAFCPPAGQKPDSAAVQPRLVLTAGRVRRADLTLFGFTNDGRAWRGAFAVSPDYDFSASRDSVIVQRRRLTFTVPPLLRDAAIALGAFFVGRATVR